MCLDVMIALLDASITADRVRVLICTPTLLAKILRYLATLGADPQVLLLQVELVGRGQVQLLWKLLWDILVHN